MHRRIIEKDIKNNLNSDKVLLLLGARQVGKTTIIKGIKEEVEGSGEITFYINLENPEFLKLLNKHPENLFRIIGKSEKKIFVFIDEIQYLKNPSNFLKYIYDEYKNIKLIVTGSSAFYIDKNFKDSLAGRKKIFSINSLSFEEYLIFKGEEKLVKYLVEQEIPIIEKQNIFNYYYDYIKYGGYPEVVLSDNIIEKNNILEELGLSYIKKDILEANIEYSDKYYFILKILSSQIGNLLNINEIANTVNLNIATVEKYIYVMQKSFHIAIIKPFYRNIRKELTKMPKVYFYDTGLRNFFINNFETFDYRLDKGELLENIIFKRLLKKYTIDDIRFWRTQNKNEVDFVIERDKKAFEAKVNIEKFNKKKYKLFNENYSEILLEVIDLEKSLYL